MPEITFQYRTPTDEEHNYTVQQLRTHTESEIGMKVDHVPFGLMAYDGKTLTGSIIGKIFLNWLHMDLVWVAEDCRGAGLGRKLMQVAIEQAKSMKLSGVEVWTQSWQAPEFYLKSGFEEFAVLDDFIPGKKRHAFRYYIGGAK